MAPEWERASLVRVGETFRARSPCEGWVRVALVTRTNSAVVRGPALAGKGRASRLPTSSSSTDRRRTDMGALLGADLGPDIGLVGRSGGRLERRYWPASRSARAWSAGSSL